MLYQKYFDICFLYLEQRGRIGGCYGFHNNKFETWSSLFTEILGDCRAFTPIIRGENKSGARSAAAWW